jgi:superfamily II DNA helicase RecQ
MDNLMYPLYIIVKTIYTIKCNLGTNKICLIVKGSKSKTISNHYKCPTYGILNNLTMEQIKNLISLLIVNQFLNEKTIYSGYGTIIATTSKLTQWYSNINNLSHGITYDELSTILNTDEHKLSLNIPNEYNNLNDIVYKTSYDVMLKEFNLE